ncbi:hypothetical protein CTI12_AA106420 [Artemisia annua]|uniref:Uncharacterized protein n=1 Tax=Artemisia annua TaxID=35608 RepID=A0A2U1PVY1_ARTAN|nr:hypothetical protein CTI12_AA106420 [Artemisia annua]
MTTTTLANPFLSIQTHPNHLFSDQGIGSTNLSICHSGTTKLTKHRKSLTVRARANDDRLGGASVFVGGFILGGIVVGTLGAIYAPQVCLSYSSRAFFEIILVNLLKVVQVIASGESSKVLYII